MPESPNPASRPKHRACDECRTRKLACTKEPDGCCRCRRDGTTCVYSAQRPMGRPRKRPRPDATGFKTASASASSSSTAFIAATATAAAAPAEADPGGLSFLADQAATPGSFFFDLFGLGDTELDRMGELPAVPPPTQPAAFVEPPLSEAESREVGRPVAWGGWGVFSLTSIDFGSVLGDTPADGPGSGPGQDATMQGTMPTMLPTPPQTAPPTTQTTQTYDDTGGGWWPQSEAPGQACGCLERMYQALESLHELPDEMTAAIRVARDAAHVAYDTIQCTRCSLPGSMAEAMLASPMLPLRTVQNTTVLGALLPAIAHAYRQIIAMVDAEAVRAAAAKQQLSVSVRAYGGVWGGLAPLEGMCLSMAGFDGSPVEAPLWRLVVRALLKVDVYGVRVNKAEAGGCRLMMDLEGTGGGEKGSRPRIDMDGPLSNEESFSLHLGLRDIVELMEQRYQMRHACLDAAVEAGLLVESAAECGYQRLQPGQQHSCQRAIDMAKREIDKLVIV